MERTLHTFCKTTHTACISYENLLHLYICVPYILFVWSDILARHDTALLLPEPWLYGYSSEIPLYLIKSNCMHANDYNNSIYFIVWANFFKMKDI